MVCLVQGKALQYIDMYIYQLDDLIFSAVCFYTIYTSTPPVRSVFCSVESLVKAHHHHHYYTTPRL